MSKKILSCIGIVVILIVLCTTVNAATVKKESFKVTTKNKQKMIDVSHLGDLNGDKKIGAADLRLAMRFSSGLEKPTTKQIKNGDLNQNGKIDSADSRMILRKISGLTKADADINGDNKVNASDAREILRMTSGKPVKLTRLQAFVADANGDGKITTEDATLVLRHSVGL